MDRVTGRKRGNGEKPHRENAIERRLLSGEVLQLTAAGTQ
jgi:hypothetical protein